MSVLSEKLWRLARYVLLAVIGLPWCVSGQTACAQKFFNYEPFYVKPVPTRSVDDTYILYLVNQDPVVVRRCVVGSSRCKYFRHILRKLESTGVTSYIEEASEDMLAVSYLRGDHLPITEWKREENMQMLIDALHRFYKTLVNEKYPARDLITVCKRCVEKRITDPQQKNMLTSLVNAWDKKYTRLLEDTTKGVVHGDLHTANIIVDQARKRVKLVDFGMCGRGYVLEDFARFSVYNALSEEEERWWLAQWVLLGYAVDEFDLLQHVKALFLLVYALTEARVLTEEEKRSAFFCMSSLDVDAEWIAKRRVQEQMISADVSKLLTYAIRMMRKSCGLVKSS